MSEQEPYHVWPDMSEKRSRGNRVRCGGVEAQNTLHKRERKKKELKVISEIASCSRASLMLQLRDIARGNIYNQIFFKKHKSRYACTYKQQKLVNITQQVFKKSTVCNQYIIVQI